MRTADHVLAMRIEEGAAGYGIYVMLLELLRDSESRSLVLNPKNLAFAINEPDLGLVERIITKYSLFDVKDDNTFTSPWLEQQMQEYDEKKKAASEAGKRGAAKRYGQVVGQKPATDSDPIATPCPPPSLPYGNIINNIQRYKDNESKSKLLNMQFGAMGGLELFNLARQSGTPLDEVTRDWAKSEQTRRNNEEGEGTFSMDMLLDAVDMFKLNNEQFLFLCQFTDYGRWSLPQSAKLRNIISNVRQTNFSPKYPQEYLLVKLIEQ